MPFQPGVSDGYVNTLLTNLSIGFVNESYISDRLFPVVFVDEPTGLYAKYDKHPWFRDEARLRGPGTVAHRSGWTQDNSSTYRCLNYSIGKEIPWEVRDAARAPYDLNRDATRWVVDKLQMRREVDWGTSFFTTSVWTTDKTGGTHFTKFSDYGASDPIGTFRDYKRTVLDLIFRYPNALVMGDLGWDTLADHPDFIERIKGAASSGNPAVVTRQLVASVLELERIEVGMARYSTSAEGASSPSYSAIFDDDMLLMYVPASASLFTPSAGYTFVWRNSTAPNAPQTIRTYDDRVAMVDVVEGHTWYDQVVTAADAGLFMSDAVD